MYGMGFNLLLVILVGIFKPDTRCVNPFLTALASGENGVELLHKVLLPSIVNKKCVAPPWLLQQHFHCYTKL